MGLNVDKVIDFTKEKAKRHRVVNDEQVAIEMLESGYDPTSWDDTVEYYKDMYESMVESYPELL